MAGQQSELLCADPLRQSVQVVKGVGPQLARKLEARGLTTVEDLLFNLPVGYVDHRGGRRINELRAGEYVSFVANIFSAKEVQYRRRRLLEVVLSDGSGLVTAKWFHYGAWLVKRFNRVRGKVRVSGTLRLFGGRLEMHHPEVEEVEAGQQEIGGIVPRYSAIPGVSRRTYRRLMAEVVNCYVPRVPETLPAAVRRYFDLLDLQTALRQVHFPSRGPEKYPSSTVSPELRRLIFEELFFLELQILRGRQRLCGEAGQAMTLDKDFLRRVGKLLPFKLTAAQRRVMREIAADLSSGRAMNRLVQGDVGCGKTIVALLTALIVIANGFQAAVMAPTEILAQQHFFNMASYARALGIPFTLLTSRIAAAEKKSRTEAIARGEASLVVGTHALIQERVTFNRLGLVIIDEQHRFGVLQRLALRRKGVNPHLLVMTATPIPRTLAMTLYGDLEVSTIDELPPGRPQVQTVVLEARERKRVYELLRQEFLLGRQAYVIYPLVEESENSELQDVVSMTSHLQDQVFPDIKVGMLHGRLSSEEKQAIMTDFARKKIQLLVATTVIEVGIDVPDATVMVIEHPERFGLSQLHQLRGRVGRGKHPSHCILVHQGGGRESRARLAIMEQTNDGFRIAEEDLRLRGPGELAGVQQSGFANLKMANLLRDVGILRGARRAAMALIARDPEIEKPEHAAIRSKLQRQNEQAAALLGTC
ncbi:MAG: ATP-dependent DNA helicase RecG [Deltaproteobacteria bacterium]|nr:ATP-dependent DNA helicase RecG [Deltaproteobacteria bacterium]MBW2070202.1 ATP-dependent DNA helicase RecG [Deltaproteobacteria bacterium]